MKEHLKFLHTHRKTLRLKVNAAEDLLLNGAREPEDRGACLHLLSKIDFKAVQSMLTRTTEADLQARVLAGIVRFSTDVGILLLYLERVADLSSRREAAGALSTALGRLDFKEVSDNRLVKMLEMAQSLFDEHELEQVLFGLLQNAGFRERFDGLELDEGLAKTFLPLRAVHAAMSGEGTGSFSPELIEEGARRVLHAPHDVLRGYPGSVRRRLFEKAAPLVKGRTREETTTLNRALDVLLKSFHRLSRSYTDLALVRASTLLRAHQDGRARELLERLRKAHPNFRAPTVWLEALSAPREGRIAIGHFPKKPGDRQSAATAKPNKQQERIRHGFWLDGQRGVWFFLGSKEDQEGFAESCRIQETMNIAGIAPLLAHGVAEEGVPYAAVPATTGLFPLLPMIWETLHRSDVVAGCAEAVRILNMLARLGLAIPDAAPDRFLYKRGGTLWLADTSGLRASEDAATQNFAAAAPLVKRLVKGMSKEAREADRGRTLAALAAANSLDDLARRLVLLG
jgi:hypothetical protein